MPDDGISQELLDYTCSVFVPEDPAVHRLTEAAIAAGMPAGWQISPEVGRLFQILCRASGAKRVLEFGTFAGHSALYFARAISPTGRVLSLESSPVYADFARAQLLIAGIGDRVEIRVGAALDLLPGLAGEAAESGTPFDIIFLDADKAHYPEFLEWAVTVLRPGGLLLADNVLSSESWNGQTLLDPASDDPRILAIREFNSRLAAHPRFLSMIVPVRAGIAVGYFQG